MTSTDPFPKGGIDYHHEQDTHFNSTSDQVSNDPKVNNKNNLGTESSEEHARRPRQNSRIPISNLLCPEEPPKPHSEDRTLPEPETLPPIRPRHQYAYDGWDLPTKPSSSSSTSVPVPPESHHYKFGQPYSYRQPHRSLVAIHEDDTPNKRTSSSSQFPKDYPKPQTSGEARRPSATYHDSFQPRHDPYPLAQSPFDHSKIKSFRDGDRTFAPTLRRDSGLGPPAFATPLSARSSIDAFQESCHPYDVEHKARSKAKSDFVLHQQNYGPYLDASPQLASATLFTPTNTNTKLHEKNSTPSSSRYVDAPAPPSPVALALTSYDQRHLPSSSSSHTPSPHEYIPQPHRTFQGEAIHPDHGPMTPSSPTYCATERHSAPRIYGIDAADTPRPPSSYNAKSPYALQRAPDEFSSSDASRRHSMGQVGNNYHRPPSRDLRFLDYTSGRDFGPPRYEHPWASSMPHPPSYSPPSEPCIQPPSWYQSYAHAPKAHDDRTWFPEQEPRPPLTPRHSDHGHPYSGSWAPYTGPPHGYQEMELSEARCRDHDQSSRRPSRPSSHSVHPFDVTNPASPPSSSSTHRPQMSSPTNNKGNKRAQEDSDPFIVEDGIKAKRKRANASQLSVLNAAFEKSYFPSTEERLRLSKECKMCPRTVQIWFQNKRQSVKARPEALDAALMAGQNGSGRRSSMMDMRRASESGPGGPMRVREERQRAVTTATTTGLGIKRLLEEKEEERVKKEKEDVRETSHHHHHNNNDNNGNSHSQNSNGGPAAMDGDFSRKRRATIAKME